MGDRLRWRGGARQRASAIAADWGDGVRAARGARPQWRPRTLRARLVASHVAVLLFALAIVLALSAALLRQEAGRAEVERLGDLAVPLAVEARLYVGRVDGAEGAGRLRRQAAAEALRVQAEEMGVRLLVFDPDGVVLFDSAAGAGADLTGQTLAAYAEDIAAVAAAAERRAGIERRLVIPKSDAANGDPLAGQRVVLAAGSQRPLGGDGLARREVAVLGVAAPPQPRPLVRRFLPWLLLALVVSLALATVASWALSRRLAAPLARLTAAADAMAAGKLEQRVPGEGADELGRLVGSFNAMSARVTAASRSQRDLLANVAHELRTPLTSIRGYAQALRDGVAATPTERARAVATLGEEAERMGALVGQLLELARLEAGQLPLRAARVGAAALVERAVVRFAPEAARRDVALVGTPAVADPTDGGAAQGLAVWGDPGRLDQVLANLVANALRHTPAGGTVAVAAEAVRGPAAGVATPAAGVAASATAPDAAPGAGAHPPRPWPGARATGARGPWVRLTVRDTGAGIPPRLLPTLFDRFSRGDSPATGDLPATGDGADGEANGAERPGFGLGLAIVRELVAAHGGTVAVTSRPGAGTTFTVELPGAG